MKYWNNKEPSRVVQFILENQTQLKMLKHLHINSIQYFLFMLITDNSQHIKTIH